MFNKQDDCTLTAEQIDQKSQSLLESMTLKEKVWMLNGNWNPLMNTIRYKNPYNPTPISTNGCSRLGVSPIRFTDGPRGVVMGQSTCFPVSMARGASFDRNLERRVGDVIGKESRAQGANYFAGVCMNLLRHPAWGRAQETYSEDPYHLGEMGKALTESVQAHHVMVCLKHYAVNNIENSRFRVNVKADERALREVYLPHFKKSVDAGAASLMGAYNLYAGDQCCESHYLLTKILREDWGFKGFTSSDFLFGIRDTVKAIKAGMDLEMPMPIKYQKHLLKAVKEGKVSEAVIDKSVLRILSTLLVFENSTDKMVYNRNLVAHEDHIALAKEVAEKSMVLIKNRNNVLPFKQDVKKMVVIGKLAKQANTGDHGSSRIYAPYVVTQLEGFQNYFKDNVEIIYCDGTDLRITRQHASEADCVVIVAGNDYNDEGECVTPDADDDISYEIVVDGLKNQGKKFQALITKLGMKKQMKSYSDEGGLILGGDRASLSLKSEEIELIKAVGGVNPNTVVTLIGGSMIMTKEWDDDVPAIMYGWYSGMEGGNALPRLLFGDVNPSGKLPFSIPTDERHLPYFSSTDREIEYDLYHGYSLLEKNGHKPAYPFGFGLSYTVWNYQDLNLLKKDNRIDVQFTVHNSGKMDGEEVVQVYVGVKNSKIDRQHKLLKGFEKVFVAAGESEKISILINIDELRYFSNEQMKWMLEPGKYIFFVGPSSDDGVLLTQELDID
jgi:beta-glucosidase